jgi:hypothetical protein
MPKLNWEYDQTHDCEVAFYNGYMIKAERDDDSSNPFEAEDGHWPMLVRNSRERKPKIYDKCSGACLDDPLSRFSDAHLVHDQKALARVLDTDPNTWAGCEQEPSKWHTDASFLRDAFSDALYEVSGSDLLATYAALYGLLGVPCANTSSRGYSQSDYAELLVVATPEAQRELRSQPADMSDEDWKAVLDEDMQTQVELYSAWAWGAVYGYTLWAPVFDEDGEVEDWEQLDDSCWGYYGADHDESGLEEAALAALPEEPVSLADMKHDAQMADLEEDPGARL